MSTFPVDDSCDSTIVDECYKGSSESARGIVDVLAAIIDSFNNDMLDNAGDIASVQSMVKRRLKAAVKGIDKVLQSVADDVFLRIAGLLADTGSQLAQIQHAVYLAAAPPPTQEEYETVGADFPARELTSEQLQDVTGGTLGLVPGRNELIAAFLERVRVERERRQRETARVPVDTGERQRDIVTGVVIPTGEERQPELLPLPREATITLPPTLEQMLACLCRHLTPAQQTPDAQLPILSEPGEVNVMTVIIEQEEI